MDEVWIDNGNKDLLTKDNFHINDTIKCCANCMFEIGDWGGGLICSRYDSHVCPTGRCNKFAYKNDVSEVHYDGRILKYRVITG